VPLRETVRGFREILDGKHDDLPEQAFYMVGRSKKRSSAPKNCRRLNEGYLPGCPCDPLGVSGIALPWAALLRIYADTL
jgi:hypothetical protein